MQISLGTGCCGFKAACSPSEITEPGGNIFLELDVSNGQPLSVLQAIESPSTIRDISSEPTWELVNGQIFEPQPKPSESESRSGGRDSACQRGSPTSLNLEIFTLGLWGKTRTPHNEGLEVTRDKQGRE